MAIVLMPDLFSFFPSGWWNSLKHIFVSILFLVPRVFLISRIHLVNP